MDQYNWLVTEILVQQRMRELETAPRVRPEPPAHDGFRRTLATKIVRLGLRLDPAAGERLALTLAHEGRR